LRLGLHRRREIYRRDTETAAERKTGAGVRAGESSSLRVEEAESAEIMGVRLRLKFGEIAVECRQNQMNLFYLRLSAFICG
jgi:hypothetical protein